MITLFTGIGIATVNFWATVFNTIWNWIVNLFN